MISTNLRNLLIILNMTLGNIFSCYWIFLYNPFGLNMLGRICMTFVILLQLTLIIDNISLVCRLIINRNGLDLPQ